MAKPEKPRSGFVIKITNETVQKLAEEEQHALSKTETYISLNEPDAKNETQNSLKEKQDASLEVRSTDEKGDNIENPESATPSEKKIKDSEKDSSDACNPEWGDYAPYITYEGEIAIYTDPLSKQRYTWSQETSSWAAKNEDTSRVYSYENDTHVYTESDGSKCFWDEEKKAWLPKVDDDFMAFYQMSYGFVDNTTEEKKDDKLEEKEKKKRSLNYLLPSKEKWNQLGLSPLKKRTLKFMYQTYL